MNQRKTKVVTSLGPDDLLLHGLQGHEALSQPFIFNLTLLNELKQPPIDQANLLGTVMTVHAEPAVPNDPAADTKPMRYFNGYVTRVMQDGVRGRFRLYRVELRPWLWFLDKASNCRVFQKKTVPQIVEEVFTKNGFSDFEKKLGSYEPREYCVQYRETDLAFVQRLLEHEGIYYYFKHADGKHTLVLSDGSVPHTPLPQYAAIDYAIDNSVTADALGERIDVWRPVQQVCAGSYALKDYDFEKPSLPHNARLAAAKPHKLSSFEKFDYPGGYVEDKIGERYARVRLQAEQALFDTVQGEGNTHGLAPGSTFTLAKFPASEQNAEHLVISADYSFALDPYEATDDLVGQVYRCTFTALKTTTTYRPQRLTPRPTIAGLQTAKVVGPAGEEIRSEKGCVKVQFAWDREGKFDDNSSCWIRVAQVWAGSGWGTQHIPRIGNEVVVSFLDGDPDRPLVTGSVYNGTNTKPFEPFISGVKTDSTKDATGYNELSFNDKQGEELITLYAQRDKVTSVKNDMTTTVEHNITTSVKNEMHTTVDNVYDVKVGQASVTLKKESLVLAFGTTKVSLSNTELKLELGAASIVLSATGVAIKGTMIDANGSSIKQRAAVISIN